MSYGFINGGMPATFADAMRTHGLAMAEDFADDPAKCGCRGGGWWLSNYDTYHQCAAHYTGQMHPEEAMAQAEDREAFEEWKATPAGIAAIAAENARTCPSFAGSLQADEPDSDPFAE